MTNNVFSLSPNYKQQIKLDVKKRRIEYLIHFTSINNLRSILNQGLSSIQFLKQTKTQYDFNDAIRLDGHPNSISLSVMFPNYSMLSKYRLYSDEPKDMIILALEPSIIWEKDCAFYYNNAANNVFKGISLPTFKTFNSWENMFAEEVDNRNRSILNIPNNYTTNPQAEILVFNSIEPRYIKEILFESQTMYDKYEDSIPDTDIPIYLHPDIYSSRKDYIHWKK